MPMIDSALAKAKRRRLSAVDLETRPACRRPTSAGAPAHIADGPGGRDRALGWTRGWLERNSAMRSAERVCAATRTGSVSSDFSITQALNGDRLGPV